VVLPLIDHIILRVSWSVSLSCVIFVEHAESENYEKPYLSSPMRCITCAINLD
jgi:hypothetical protein